MKNTIKLAIFLSIPVLSIFLMASPAKASTTATISVSPATGSHVAGSTFDVTITVSGGGQSFTTFGADVALSNLTVTNLTYSAYNQNTNPTGLLCTTTPTTSSPSFFCGVTNAATSVNALTMTVRAVAEGSASITLTNGSVIQTLDGAHTTEIFSSFTNGSYTVTAVAAPTPTPTPVVHHTTPTAGPSNSNPFLFAQTKSLSGLSLTANYLIIGGAALTLILITMTVLRFVKARNRN